MAPSFRSGRGRPRGTVGWLPSGSARVKVYAGVDQLTGKKLWLRETVAARPTRRETEREAEKVLTRLLNQVDERRTPRTEATVNELLDRWLEVIDVERTTRAGYVGKIEKHIRPTIGRLQVGRVQVETIETLYARLRRCRDHCRGQAFVQHRTAGEHVCDEHSARRKCAKTTGNPDAPCRYCDRACRPHQCTPLAAGSIRVVHAILSGTFQRAVRWGWITVNPIEQTEPPSTPRPNPDPPTSDQAALIVTEAWKDPAWGLFVWMTLTIRPERRRRARGGPPSGHRRTTPGSRRSRGKRSHYGHAVVYVPTDASMSTGRVRAIALPARQQALTVHRGDHHDIDVTYGALARRLADHALFVDGPVHETHLVGPRDTGDPAARRTEMGRPVSAPQSVGRERRLDAPLELGQMGRSRRITQSHVIEPFISTSRLGTKYLLDDAVGDGFRPFEHEDVGADVDVGQCQLLDQEIDLREVPPIRQLANALDDDAERRIGVRGPARLHLGFAAQREHTGRRVDRCRRRAGAPAAVRRADPAQRHRRHRVCELSDHGQSPISVPCWLMRSSWSASA